MYSGSHLHEHPVSYPFVELWRFRAGNPTPGHRIAETWTKDRRGKLLSRWNAPQRPLDGGRTHDFVGEAFSMAGGFRPATDSMRPPVEAADSPQLPWYGQYP